MKFIPRTSKPELGNKYYTRVENGGCSCAIKGSPTDECDALSNCVGYSYGRIAECSGRASCDLCEPTSPANFDKYLYNGLTTGTEPKLGAIIVWDKHVENVEAIIDDTTIVTSGSYYGGDAFQLNIRRKVDGSWVYKDYKFKTFIYTPFVDQPISSETQSNLLAYRQTQIDKLNTELCNANMTILEQSKTISELEIDLEKAKESSLHQDEILNTLQEKVYLLTQELEDSQKCVVAQTGDIQKLEELRGDANNNGKIDIGDLILILKKLLEK